MKVGNLVRIVEPNPGEEKNLGCLGIVTKVLESTSEVLVLIQGDASAGEWIYFYDQVREISNHLAPAMERLPAAWKSQSRIYGEACELWVADNLSCPSCASGRLVKLEANEPSIDHRCATCEETFQVKAKGGSFLKKNGAPASIIGAAYGKTLDSLSESKPWSMLLVGYRENNNTIAEVHYIPAKNISAKNIIPRAPLGPHCRRAGWQGCNLVFRKDDIHTLCQFS